ncbi:hypothetical protein ES703_125914 [subsurface metagenome]
MKYVALISSILLVICLAILVPQNRSLTQENIELREQFAGISQAWSGAADVREFSSVEELKEWLAQDDTDEIPFVEGTFDCDDFARTLFYRAFYDGYIIGYYTHGTHARNICFIGEDFYSIEPSYDGVYYLGKTWE